jgi:hypothetical protein
MKPSHACIGVKNSSEVELEEFHRRWTALATRNQYIKRKQATFPPFITVVKQAVKNCHKMFIQ